MPKTDPFILWTRIAGNIATAKKLCTTTEEFEWLNQAAAIFDKLYDSWKIERPSIANAVDLPDNRRPSPTDAFPDELEPPDPTV